MVAGASIVVGLILVVSGALKARAPEWPALAVEFGLPKAAAPVLPWVEVGLGALLTVQLGRPWTAAAVLVVLAGFTAAIAVHLLQGHRVACGCFGQASLQPVGPVDLIRNVALLALAVVATGVGGSPVRWAAGGVVALAIGAWLAAHTLRTG